MNDTKDIKTVVRLFLDQLWRRRWPALAVAWGVCVVGWLGVFCIPNRYVSEARFHVDTTSLLTPLLKGISVNSDDQSRDRQVSIMERTLTSRPNLLKVTRMTDLDKTDRSEAAVQELLTDLEERISIRSQGENLFLVQFSDRSPVIARNVVQALLTIFVESSVGDKREDIKSARTFIDAQIEEYQAQLKAAERKVAEFKVKNIQYLSSTSQNFAARMEATLDSVKAAKFEFDDAVAQSARLRLQLNTTPQYLSVNSAPQVVVGGATGYPAVGSLQRRAQSLRIRLDELRQQFTDKHPDVVAAQKSLDNLLAEQKKAAIASATPGEGDDFTTQVPNDLYNQLSLRLAAADDRAATAKRKLIEAQSVYDAMQTRASEAPRIEAEFTNLTRDYEVFRTSYDMLIQRRESARIAAAADSTAEPIQFRLIAAPELPALPSGPNRAVFNSMVLLAALAAACGYVALLMQIEQRVHTIHDLAYFPDVRVLGCVSDICAPSEKAPRLRLLNKFSYAAASLAAAFVAVLVVNPNISMIATLAAGFTL